MEEFRQLNLDADFGGSKQVDVEVSGTEQLWVAMGPGFLAADLWLKSGGDTIDLRVRVRRTTTGIEVLVDRGDPQSGWWAPEAAPRLNIVVDRSGGTAHVAARIGDSQDFQEVLLGQTAI